MKMSMKDKIHLAREHAIAVLMDKGKILEGAVKERIPTLTLVAMLDITYEDGNPIKKNSADKALLHWHDTGFLAYLGRPDMQTNKQKAAKDKRLIKTAIAETMKNRRDQWKFSTRGPK